MSLKFFGRGQILETIIRLVSQKLKPLIVTTIHYYVKRKHISFQSVIDFDLGGIYGWLVTKTDRDELSTLWVASLRANKQFTWRVLSIDSMFPFRFTVNFPLLQAHTFLPPSWYL